MLSSDPARTDCLLMSQLPFADDIRDMEMPAPGLASLEQEETMKQASDGKGLSSGCVHPSLVPRCRRCPASRPRPASFPEACG